jgi:hypothetical protein
LHAHFAIRFVYGSATTGSVDVQLGYGVGNGGDVKGVMDGVRVLLALTDGEAAKLDGLLVLAAVPEGVSVPLAVNDGDVEVDGVVDADTVDLMSPNGVRLAVPVPVAVRVADTDADGDTDDGERVSLTVIDRVTLDDGSKDTDAVALTVAVGVFDDHAIHVGIVEFHSPVTESHTRIELLPMYPARQKYSTTKGVPSAPS